MKRLFMTVALAALVTMPLIGIDAGLPKNSACTPLFLSETVDKAVKMKEAPVCDAQKIVSCEKNIKQVEYRNALMRAGVYVCVFAGASYLGYKYFSAEKVVASGTLNFTEKEMAALKTVAATAQSSFLSTPWFKSVFFSVRDMLIQSAAIAGLYEVGNYFQKHLFYGKRIDEFFVRSTNIVRTKADIEGYAAMLETPEYGACYRSELLELVKDRTLELCKSVETVVAYMHIVRDGLDIQSKTAFMVAEQFLITRTNATLESLWQFSSTTEKKPAELARGIALTMAIFTQDFGQAIDRFDGAYYMATHTN
jgi:hypothetical protein